ncbi:hypothetical protein AB833_23855 [Chromatiales bacterium (ex Bugula neritina AB1)]|nr:hypothetical protein AB833_23855 [Chromatiales bacterium (ex Bugula neritina AB1)]
MLTGSVTSTPALQLQSQSSQTKTTLSSRFASANAQITQSNASPDSTADRTIQASGNLSVEDAARNLDFLSTELDRITLLHSMARQEMQTQQNRLDAADAGRQAALTLLETATDEFQQLKQSLLGTEQSESDLTGEELTRLNSSEANLRNALENYRQTIDHYDAAKSSYDATALNSASIEAALTDVSGKLQTGLDELTLSVLHTVTQQIVMDTLVTGFNKNNQISESLRLEDF